MKLNRIISGSLAAIVLATATLGACASETKKSASDTPSEADSAATSEAPMASAASVMNYNTFIKSEKIDDFLNVYIRPAAEIAATLKKAGFTLTSSEKTQMYTSDETPVAAKWDTYKKGGIQIFLTYTTDPSCVMTTIGFFCEDDEPLEELRKSFEANGFTYQEASGRFMVLMNPEVSLVVFNSSMNEGEILMLS